MCIRDRSRTNNSTSFRIRSSGNQRRYSILKSISGYYVCSTPVWNPTFFATKCNVRFRIGLMRLKLTLEMFSHVYFIYVKAFFVEYKPKARGGPWATLPYLELFLFFYVDFTKSKFIFKRHIGFHE